MLKIRRMLPGEERVYNGADSVRMSDVNGWVKVEDASGWYIQVKDEMVIEGYPPCRVEFVGPDPVRVRKAKPRKAKAVRAKGRRA